MHSESGTMATKLVLAVFRLNGLLVEEGDRLAAPLGLTSARWQVLGAISMAVAPPTVPQIAVAMGMSRQGARKQINLLAASRLIEAIDNPAHKRSLCYRLTRRGDALYTRMHAIQVEWINSISRGMSASALRSALRQLDRLAERLDDLR